MTEVFIVSDNILSPLGSTSDENFARLKKSISGIKKNYDLSISPQPFYGSLFEPDAVFLTETDKNVYTKFEQMLIASITDALKNSGIEPGDERTILILSTTKGNISLLETCGNSRQLKERVVLPHSAKLVARYFNFVNQPIVVSNACISGSLALLTGQRLIQSGKYDHAVVAGADVISAFVVSGFESFQAVSQRPCKPFDAERNGLNLGEGAATIVLSANKRNGAPYLRLAGGSVSNDANHISGPSRSGEELYQAIRIALQCAQLSQNDIHFISAHGTATMYNDEMEAKAITLAGLQSVPVNSLKGYYGHTLGAAGLIECVISCYSLRENLVLPTMGFEKQGVSKPLNICDTLQSGTYTNCLKTASGFGGCNAAVVFSKQ